MRNEHGSEIGRVVAQHDSEAEELLLPLVNGRPAGSLSTGALAAVVIGELIGMTNDGRTPLVMYEGQPGSAALEARSTVDLHSAHVGHQIVLTFVGADPRQPVVMGVLRESTRWPVPDQPATVDVDVDGERMVISAKEQLVLRCGKASVTLTKAGKVLIQGTYVSSRSSGVNRVKGGSVQLN